VNRLSLRIFLSFFAALLAIAAGAILITWWVLADREPESGPGLRRVAAEAARALAAGGRPGLERWAADLEAEDPTRPPVLVIDDDGREILDRRLPRRLRRAIAAAERDLRVPGAAPVTLRLPQRLPLLVAGDGSRYRLIMPARNRVERGLDGLADTRLPLLLLALGVAAAFSGLLARSITRPVRDLERATESLAAGRLDTRVAPATRARGDELGRLAAAFDAMAARLAGLVEGRERLLRDVSHELRSPLARMRLATGLARQPQADLPRQLQRIELEISRLDGLVGAILDVSRLDAGAEAMAFRTVDAAALVDEIVEDARFEAEATGRHLDWPGVEAPVELQADPRWLAAAIENVVRNALRHTPEGTGVRLALETNPESVTLRIADDGPGIPEQELERIFEPFHRVGQDRDRSTGGAGLGLAIAARVVAAHGGRIAARNLTPARQTPSGLEVSVWLPRQSAGRRGEALPASA
jgi:two-component system sensor histidine kinase CpxA